MGHRRWTVEHGQFIIRDACIASEHTDGMDFDKHMLWMCDFPSRQLLDFVGGGSALPRGDEGAHGGG